MGKKGGAKNKLARMSEEERARYLQHRADIEEEAKRRKQQLIAMYMKVKQYIPILFIQMLVINKFYIEQTQTRRCIQSIEFSKNQSRMAIYFTPSQMPRNAWRNKSNGRSFH